MTFVPNTNLQLTDDMERACALLAPIQHQIYCWLQSKRDPRWLELTSLEPETKTLLKGDVVAPAQENSRSSSSSSSTASTPALAVSPTTTALTPAGVPDVLEQTWTDRGYLALRPKSHLDYVDPILKPDVTSYGQDIGTRSDLGYPQYSFGLMKETLAALADVGVVKVEGLIPLHQIRAVREALRIKPILKGPYAQMRDMWNDKERLGMNGPDGENPRIYFPLEY